MSIVAEILQCTGKLAKENIVLKVDDLKKKLEASTFRVEEIMKEKYVDYYPQYVKLEKFLLQLKQYTAEYENLHNQIEKEIKPQMVNSVAEFNSVLEEMKKIKQLKAALKNLKTLCQHLESAKSCKTECIYLEAAYHLNDFEVVFKEIHQNLPQLMDTSILYALNAEFYMVKEGLIYDIGKKWKENVVISSHSESRNKKYITLSVNKERIMFEEVFKALHLLKYLRPVLKEFGKQFMKVLCEVLIYNNVKISVDDASSVLTVTILNEQSSPPNEVFESLVQIFEFIYDKIFKLCITNEEEVEISAMNEFGNVISEDFFSLIIDKCLKVAIPTQSSQLETFHVQITAAENFCNQLHSLGFCNNSSNSLLNFIMNVDVLPVNKIAQDILSKARTLMKKSLHQTVASGVECIATSEAEESQDVNDIAEKNHGLSKSTFLFPRCQISVSVKELVKLLKDVKGEAKNIGPIHAHRFYYVARNICVLYCCVVPTFHKEEIQNIPQQTAIFHNNCMYLAHKLSLLGYQHESELQCQIPMTFVDLVPEIKKLGAEAFLQQMRHQKQQLLQLIQEQQAYQAVMVDPELINRAEKSIRQCLCQLKLLQKVWSEVLPSEVYFKAIGTLFNTCLEEIILRVLSMEDISADAAAHMDSMFSIFLKQGPDIFKIQSIDKRNSVHFYVRRWFKFQELQLVLSASMREIVDRWSSGKGPLAAHFNADEVKHLIRALFQNTERRAAALAKIK